MAADAAPAASPVGDAAPTNRSSPPPPPPSPPNPHTPPAAPRNSRHTALPVHRSPPLVAARVLEVHGVTERLPPRPPVVVPDARVVVVHRAEALALGLRRRADIDG